MKNALLSAIAACLSCATITACTTERDEARRQVDGQQHIHALLDMPPPPPPAEAKVATAHICWIDRVVGEADGVRIFFVKGAPVPDPARGLFAAAGATLRPGNSGHDGCTLTVERRAGRLGVAADAFFFLPGVSRTPMTSYDWIPAELPAAGV